MNTILLQAAAGGSAQVMNIVMIVGMVAVFYFFMIRPQQKKQKEQAKFMEELKKGDQVVTVSGMHGKIVEISGSKVVIEIDRGVKVTFEKSSVSAENTAAVNSTDKK